MPMSSAQHTPPGPPARKSTLGSLRYYRSMFTDPVGFVRERFDRYGDIYYAPSNGVGLFVLRHPDHLHEMLAKNASAFGKSHSGLTRIERFVGNIL